MRQKQMMNVIKIEQEGICARGFPASLITMLDDEGLVYQWRSFSVRSELTEGFYGMISYSVKSVEDNVTNIFRCKEVK